MKIQRTMCATHEDVQDYADLVGDHNPLHVDEQYVESDATFSDENLVHGALIQGWFSGLLNEVGSEHLIDGEVLLLDMDVRFENPLYVGDNVDIEIEIDDDHDTDGTVIVPVALQAVDRDGTVYAHGQATVSVNTDVNRADHTA